MEIVLKCNGISHLLELSTVSRALSKFSYKYEKQLEIELHKAGMVVIKKKTSQG